MEQRPINIPHTTEKLLEIRRFCSKNGVLLDDHMLANLDTFVQLLLEWNTRINLISRKDVENVWEAHILHSLSILFQGEIPKDSRILDLGSGGGLPGIPLGIVRPDTSLTLLDATRKKIDAVSEMVKRLKLDHVSTVWGRAEDKVVINQHKNMFDLVVARAVAPLQDLVRWALPFLDLPTDDQTKRVRLITLKGGDLGSEVDKVRRMRSVQEVRVKALTFYGAERIPGVEKQIVLVTL